ncbi:ABC transporter substrate-binding protein [Psychromonas aquatilis]|uniref:ABC transporter substrate-binding protein n=1 Tax=Psychromonas aquatilis TaxID=2005072 RepID=A0ABU9GR72_9GAMM
MINLIKWLAISCVVASVVSCKPYEKPINIGAAPWPTFEFAFLAKQLGYFDEQQFTLLELTSSTSVIQAFQTGKLDIAFLSLDEVLTLVALGIDLKIVSVIDSSKGGDALLSKQKINHLSELKFKTIGYENKSAGALLLDEAFTLSSLNNQTVELLEVKQNEAKHAYLSGKVDALIVKEPIKQELLALGAHEIINSTILRDPIVNVLIVSGKTFNEREDDVVNFVRQYYRAHLFYQKNKEEARATIAVRLQLYPHLFENALTNTQFITAKNSLMRLSGQPSNLEYLASKLSRFMIEKRMLSQIQTDFDTLISPRILERAIYE